MPAYPVDSISHPPFLSQTGRFLLSYTSDRLPSLTPTEVAAGHRSPVPLCAPGPLSRCALHHNRVEVPTGFALCSTTTVSQVPCSVCRPQSPVTLCIPPCAGRSPPQDPTGPLSRCVLYAHHTSLIVWRPGPPRSPVPVYRPQLPCPGVCSTTTTGQGLSAGRRSPVPPPCALIAPQVPVCRPQVPCPALCTFFPKFPSQVPCPAVCLTFTMPEQF